jgi:alanine racemase
VDVTVDDAWSDAALARGAVADIDLAALRHNVRVLRERTATPLLAVVKADAYGHGLVACARAAVAEGAEWLGVALPTEAVRLREGGIDARVLTWLAVPGSPFEECVHHDIDVTVSARWALDAVVAAARAVGRAARVQLKVDTGLSRNGATVDEWAALVAAARAAEAAGDVEVTGIWTHFACADEPAHPSVAAQLAAFRGALDVARSAGLSPTVVHAANSAAALAVPDARFDLVRVGIAMYGLSPGQAVGTADELGLRPVMTLRGRFAAVKRVPAGSGVSYGHTAVTERETTLGLLPLGYADGVPRAGSGRLTATVEGVARPVLGRICMDQVVVDLGDADVAVGDEAVVFGAGGPSADDVAASCGTIGYEIVTRIGPRVPRMHREVTT